MFKFIKIAPPGNWCLNEAALEMIKQFNGKSFIEIGCGAGNLSLFLCKNGYKGYGVDFSSEAINQASVNLKDYTQTGQYHLIHSDFLQVGDMEQKVDFAVSMMVIEHIEDEVSFLRKMVSFVKPCGHIMVGVPGRKDKWDIEDETVGHFRRYERAELENVLFRAGLKDIKVWSVAVPIANILFNLGNLLIKSSKEVKKKKSSLHEQTKTSGIREIPFKTMFPSIFKLILNKISLYPLFIIQRLFYNSDLGLTLLGSGEVR